MEKQYRHGGNPIEDIVEVSMISVPCVFFVIHVEVKVEVDERHKARDYSEEGAKDAQVADRLVHVPAALLFQVHQIEAVNDVEENLSTLRVSINYRGSAPARIELVVGHGRAARIGATL